MSSYFGLDDLAASPDALKTDLGASWEGQPFEATREIIEQYAVATAYPTERVAESGQAPPVFGAVASISSHAGLLTRIVPHELLWRSVHLSQIMNFHGLIAVGDLVTSRAELVEVRAAPMGCAITMRVEINVGSTLVTDALHRVLLRGVSGVASSTPPSPPAPRVGKTSSLGTGEFELLDDHSILYSHVSGDHLPIHTDREMAKRAGFNGLILHGMCTFAMCAHAAIDLAGDGDPLSLSGMSATFTRPVLCGTPLRVEVAAQEDGLLRVLASQQGRSVIKDATARPRRGQGGEAE